jgi:hypothetical protein
MPELVRTLLSLLTSYFWLRRENFIKKLAAPIAFAATIPYSKPIQDIASRKQG